MGRLDLGLSHSADFGIGLFVEQIIISFFGAAVIANVFLLYIFIEHEVQHMKNAALVGALEQLVKSFNDEDGLPTGAYNGALDLIQHILGPRALALFVAEVSVQDGRYYFNAVGEDGWRTNADDEALVGRTNALWDSMVKSAR